MLVRYENQVIRRLNVVRNFHARFNDRFTVIETAFRVILIFGQDQDVDNLVFLYNPWCYDITFKAYVFTC